MEAAKVFGVSVAAGVGFLFASVAAVGGTLKTLDWVLDRKLAEIRAQQDVSVAKLESGNAQLQLKLDILKADVSYDCIRVELSGNGWQPLPFDVCPEAMPKCWRHDLPFELNLGLNSRVSPNYGPIPDSHGESTADNSLGSKLRLDMRIELEVR